MVSAKRSTAGKKAWARKSASEKAKVVSRLRRASGRSGGTKALSKRSGGSSPARTNKGQAVGAAYTATKRFIVFLAPVTDEAISEAQGRQGAQTRFNNLRNKANVDYGINLGIIAADAWLDKKTGQAAALSRGSLSAWAGEAYLAFRSAEDRRLNKDPRDTHRNWVVRHQGYDPVTGLSKHDDVGFREYRIIHHVGQGVRMLANRTNIGATITAPLKKGLSALGLSA